MNDLNTQDKNQFIPVHIAVIMDGNRRWARKRGMPAIVGHNAGVKAVRRTVEAAARMGVKVLSLYAFSTENWNRTQGEINGLMSLLSQAIQDYTGELEKNGIKLLYCGNLDRIPETTRKIILESKERLKNNKGMILNVALNYGGRQEIVDAANKAIELGLKKLDEKTFSSLLYTADLPDPDLLIRTSGELRLSNFLLWQMAYTEFYITDTLWPDFNEEELKKAVKAFSSRERRRGA